MMNSFFKFALLFGMINLNIVLSQSYLGNEGGDRRRTRGGCELPDYKGDGYCDDENNNAGCEYDGGDCCGNDVNKDYCYDCECKDPNARGARRPRRTQATPAPTTPAPTTTAPPAVDCVLDESASSKQCTAACGMVNGIGKPPASNGGKACPQYECKARDGQCPATPVRIWNGSSWGTQPPAVWRVDGWGTDTAEDDEAIALV